MANVKVRVGAQNAIKVLSSASGGRALFAEEATNVIGGIASVTALHVSGLSTFVGFSTFTDNVFVSGISTFVGVSSFLSSVNVTSNVTIGGTLQVGDTIFGTDIDTRNLRSSGITTLASAGGITTTGGDLYVGGDLFVKDDIVYDEVTGRNINITGIGTIEQLVVPGNAGIGSLNVTGISTLGGTLSVAGVATFSDVTKFDNADVVFQGAAAAQNMTWDASENDLEFTDLARIKFGDSDDLEIWHGGGNNSHIKNSTNDLKIRSDSLILKRADDSEAYLKATVNSDVKLYYNGNDKFATTDEGVNVVGNVTAVDGTFSGNVSIAGTLTKEDVTNIDSVGIVTAGKGLRVTTGGIVVTAGVSTFNDDVQFPGAAYNILWDKATSKFKFDDSAQLVFGSASGGDMKLFHQSGNSTIRNETGQFRIAGNDIRLQTQNHSEDYLLAVDGGSVSIFYNDVKRLETSSSGVDITDTLNVAGILTAATANVTGTLTAGLIDGGSY